MVAERKVSACTGVGAGSGLGLLQLPLVSTTHINNNRIGNLISE